MTRLDAWILAVARDADYQHERRRFDSALAAARFDEAKQIASQMAAIADAIARRLKREMN